ncbi:nitric oxide synthase oxygenase [Nocardia sp. NPDC059177]|uniref:nitric oxide synthase oxygenase n=1 Tax=Nocardia sp. NPDC059177 TaxID=3346759 RepID=UPI003684C58D
MGRKFWKALALVDARHLNSAAELAQACWEHLSAATNGGNIRCLLTVEPSRIWDRFRL